MTSEQLTPAGSPPSAQVVGNAFVQQYYHILHKSPQDVYRFYQESSKLGRPDVHDEMSLVVGMDAINTKIISMNYGEFTAAIKTADSQDSLDGGVIVLVTGCLTFGDNVKREFTQSFFLAPQDKGYYVLNDIFRYVKDAENQQPSHGLANGPVAAHAPEQEVPAAQEQQTIQPPNEEANEEEVYDPSDHEDGSVVEEVPVEEVIDEVPSIPQDAVAEQGSSAIQEEAPKKSYASIVKVMKENAAPLSAPTPIPSRPAPVSANQERQSAAAPTPAPASDLSADPSSDDNCNQDAEVDGHSIYIKSLPLNATPAQLEEEFKKFGPIKPGGIQVRSHKQQGFCFGFVEFEVASAVQSAIEASPVVIGGRQTFVEEKRPTGSRVSSRGRFLPGRGGGFRTDGTRGRGGYGTGRGYGRGDYGNRSDFGGRSGGRVPSSRGSESGYQRVDQTASGGRGNRPGSSGGNAAYKNGAPRVPAPA